MQQLPHQYGDELHHLHDEPLGGEREPLRLPATTARTRARARKARREPHRMPATSRRTAATASPATPARPATFTSWAGGVYVHQAERHQLLELPQRHDRDRQDHAAAYPGDRRPVQQLPHQYGGELRHLYDEPFGGEREPLRRLPQRLVHGARAPRARRAPRRMPATWRRAAATASPATPARPRLHRAGLAASTPTRPSDTNCSSCHNGTTATGKTTPPHIPVTGVQCSNCHTNTATSFTTYTMNHSAVSASRCDACHNGSYTARGHQGRAGDRVVSPATSRPAAATASPATPARRRPSPAGPAAPTSIRQATPIARAATTARPRPG